LEGGESRVKTYCVRVYIPRYYEIQAENAEEAKRKAGELFSKEQKSWITPESQAVELTGEVLPLP
jgi:hypothetical protein